MKEEERKKNSLDVFKVQNEKNLEINEIFLETRCIF